VMDRTEELLDPHGHLPAFPLLLLGCPAPQGRRGVVAVPPENVLQGVPPHVQPLGFTLGTPGFGRSTGGTGGRFSMYEFETGVYACPQTPRREQPSFSRQAATWVLRTAPRIGLPRPSRLFLTRYSAPYGNAPTSSG
jgi:hypothetical protein